VRPVIAASRTVGGMDGAVTTSTRLGRYRLVQRVGEGGMGVVHLALTDDGRTVAVKVLRPHVAGDADARRRLAREVSTLRRITHPRIAEVIDADTDGETPYVVTEYVAGQPLDAHVREHGPVTGQALAQLGDGLGEALAAIHAAGVVHRDLKPGNVLMTGDGPIVIDFGIAHVADDVRLTSTGLVMGTPGYLSPEVISGEGVGQATDWWGWAATMAFASTGRPPFGRGPIEAVLDRVRRGQADLDGVPAALVPVLARALSVDPAHRPAPGVLRMAVADLRAAATSPSKPPSSVPVLRDTPASRAPEGHSTAPMPVAVPQTRALPQQAAPRQAAPRQAAPPAPAEPEWPTPHRPRRSGTLAVGLLALCGTAAVAPVAAAIIGAIGMVIARTVDRSAGSLLRRRYERGPRRGDRAVATISSPWHLTVAALTSVPMLVLPLLVGVSVMFIAGFVLQQSNPAPGQSLPLALAAAAAVVTAWWGPGGSSLRRGTRSVVRAVTPGDVGAQVLVALLLIVAIAAVIVVVRNGGAPDWSPLKGPPLNLTPPS